MLVCIEGPYGIMVIIATGVQILDKAVSISHNSNTLEKSMNPTIFPSGQTVLFNVCVSFYILQFHKEIKLKTN